MSFFRYTLRWAVLIGFTYWSFRKLLKKWHIANAKEITQTASKKFASKCFDQAIHDFSAAISITEGICHKTTADLYYNKSLCYFMKTHYFKALLEVTEAVDHNSNHVEAWLLMAKCQLYVGNISHLNLILEKIKK